MQLLCTSNEIKKEKKKKIMYLGLGLSNNLALTSGLSSGRKPSSRPRRSRKTWQDSSETVLFLSPIKVRRRAGSILTLSAIIIGLISVSKTTFKKPRLAITEL